MKRVLFIGSQFDLHLGIWRELEDNKIENVHVCHLGHRYIDGIRGLLCRVVFYSKIRPIFNRLFKILNIVDKAPAFYMFFCNIYPLMKKEKYDIVLFLNGTLAYSPPSIEYIVERFKSKGSRVILYLLDSMNAGSPIIKNTKHLVDSPLWDEIFSFDTSDAHTYGFKFIGYCYYSKFKDLVSSDKPKFDIYFTGGLKGGREKLIGDTYLACVQNNLNPLFDLMTYNRNDINKIEGINYRNRWISYRTIVESVCNSNCILDVRQENQTGPSFRYFEAVCYNRKLLTNNPNIKDLPYYNPKWMRFFSTIEDIDWGWVKERENVQYNYKGEFSPTNLVNYLIKP